MPHYNIYKRPILTSFIILFSLSAQASDNAHQDREANKNLNQIYHNLKNKPTTDMQSRLENLSAVFLGKPYLLGALGEGSSGDYDQWPLYRTDAFDCETYVDTVLALALAKNTNNFKQCINQIRYYEGDVSYIHRNHFTCLDWNENNQQHHFVKDITTTLRGEHNKVVVKYARALIDKPSWYAHKSETTLRLNNTNPKDQAAHLKKLKEEGNRLPRAMSVIPYIPFTALFDQTGQPNQYLFDQIPNAAIIEIIRPNWNIKKVIGTNLNVSHLGFVFWKKGKLVFRQASSNYGRVVEVSLIDYLRDALKSPTIKGINIQVVLPKKPGITAGC